MTKGGLGAWLRDLFRARPAGGRGQDVAAREAALSLLSPDGQERLTFYRRSDGLWTYEREAFHIEPDHALGYWAPAEVSGLYESLAEARRDAESGGAWVVEGEAG